MSASKAPTQTDTQRFKIITKYDLRKYVFDFEEEKGSNQQASQVLNDEKKEIIVKMLSRRNFVTNTNLLEEIYDFIHDFVANRQRNETQLPQMGDKIMKKHSKEMARRFFSLNCSGKNLKKSNQTALPTHSKQHIISEITRSIEDSYGKKRDRYARIIEQKIDAGIDVLNENVVKARFKKKLAATNSI